MGTSMGREYINIALEIAMRVNSKWIRKVDMEYWFSSTGTSTRVSGKKTFSMGGGYTNSMPAHQMKME